MGDFQRLFRTNGASKLIVDLAVALEKYGRSSPQLIQLREHSDCGRRVKFVDWVFQLSV